MKKLILVSLAYFVSINVFSQGWSQAIRPNHTISSNSEIVIESGGNILNISNTINRQINVTCIDRLTLLVIWSRNYSGNGYNAISGFIDFNNDLLITGASNLNQNNGNTGMLLKINITNGNIIFQRSYDFGMSFVRGIQLDANSNNDYAIVGTNIGTIFTFFYRINSTNGNIIWAKQSNVNNNFEEMRTAYSLAQLTNGNLIFVGARALNQNALNKILILNINNGNEISNRFFQSVNQFLNHQTCLNCFNSSIDFVINIPNTNDVLLGYTINDRGNNGRPNGNINNADHGVIRFNTNNNSIIWHQKYNTVNDDRIQDMCLLNNSLYISLRNLNNVNQDFIHEINITNGNSINIYNFSQNINCTNIKLEVFNNQIFVSFLNNSNNELVISNLIFNDCWSNSTINVTNYNYNINQDNMIFFDRNIVNNLNTNINNPTNEIELLCGVNPTNCFLNENGFEILNAQNIANNRVFEGKYIVNGRVVFLGNIDVDITNCDFIFTNCNAGLYFINGAKLRANNSVFRPCNENGYWEGITFENTNNNKLHSCVIKNAVNAVNLQGLNSDAVITDNLFQNNFRGILMQNTRCSGSIAGNTFDVNNANSNTPLSCVGNLQDRSFNGIRILNSRINGSISQNNFVCQFSSFQNDRMRGIILENSSANITLNKFTNQDIAIRMVDKTIGSPVEISSNTFEYHDKRTNANPQVFISNSRNGINFSNNILNDKSNNNSFDALDLNNTTIEVRENKFSGFRTAIRSTNSRYSKFIQNEIVNPVQFGIYNQNCNDVLISCNNIKMGRLFTDMGYTFIPIGIGLYDNDLLSNSSSRVLSNCVFDAHTALDLFKTGQPIITPIPIIRNNFLYNYYHRGMNFVNCVGNIGSATNYGRNTLYSNITGVFDAASNFSTIELHYNYMMSPTTMNVTLYNNLQAHSTAYCANQINVSQKVPQNDLISCEYNAPIQVVPDFGGGISQGIIGEGGDSIGYFTILLDNDPSLFDQLKTTDLYNSLSVENKIYIEFYYNYINNKYDESILELNKLVQINNKEEYSILIEKMNSLKGEFQISNSINSYTDSIYNYYSVSNMNLNSSNAFDYFLKPYLKLNVEENILTNNPKLNSFIVFPNPASNETSVKIDNNDSKEVEIVVYDLTGKILFETKRHENNIELKLSLEDYKTGVYFITVKIDNVSNTQKIIVY